MSATILSMNPVNLAACFILIEAVILPRSEMGRAESHALSGGSSLTLLRKKRDSIGQNRLGNNIHIYRAKKERESVSPNYSYQILKWLADSDDNEKILGQKLRRKLRKCQSHKCERSHRLHHFRRYHLSRILEK